MVPLFERLTQKKLEVTQADEIFTLNVIKYSSNM